MKFISEKTQLLKAINSVINGISSKRDTNNPVSLKYNLNLDVSQFPERGNDGSFKQ